MVQNKNKIALFPRGCRLAGNLVGAYVVYFIISGPKLLCTVMGFSNNNIILRAQYCTTHIVWYNNIRICITCGRHDLLPICFSFEYIVPILPCRSIYTQGRQRPRKQWRKLGESSNCYYFAEQNVFFPKRYRYARVVALKQSFFTLLVNAIFVGG